MDIPAVETLDVTRCSGRRACAMAGATPPTRRYATLVGLHAQAAPGQSPCADDRGVGHGNHARRGGGRGADPVIPVACNPGVESTWVGRILGTPGWPNRGNVAH